MSRNTIRAALRSSTAPRYSRLRQVRPLFDPARTRQRAIYRPGETCQFDLWEPAEEIPVGHGQTRKRWVVIACLGYSRAGAGGWFFSKHTADLLSRIRRCLRSLGVLPQTLVWDRQAGLHAGDGRPTAAFAAFSGALKVDWHFCDAGDPQAKGVDERLQDLAERSFEPGRVAANERDYQLQLDCWFDTRAKLRMHKTLRARPACRHARSFACHGTVTALEHARTLKTQRAEHRGHSEPAVEVRSLAALCP
jgi:transposase